MLQVTGNVLSAAAIESLVIGDCKAVPMHAAGDIYAMPATPGQLRFWSLDQLIPGNPALNMPLMWECTGSLNIKALAQAFTLCVARHEALRTTFTLVHGKLSQIVHPPAPVALPVVDLEPLQSDSKQHEAVRLRRDHAAYHFDLKNGPLLTLKLLRIDARNHTLLVSMHHIICDGISNGILMRDMRVFYESILTVTEPVLPDLPIQFPDYAVWQDEWLAGPEPAKSLEFWHQSLGHDFSRLSVKRDEDAMDNLVGQTDVTGDIETLQIPLDLHAKAHAFCKREHITLNILLFSVFAALMNRITGQQDLVIGSPCANRTEDTEELIGLFMNIQVMRLRLQDQETFRSLLKKVETWTLGAYENQTLPFENLIHDPYFSNGSNPFEIPIFFLYQKSFMVTHQIGDLEIVPLRSESPGAVFEMMFAIVDRLEDGPRLQLEYNPRHFKASTIRRYLTIFNNLLESALAAPDSLVDELTLLAPPDRSQLIDQCNQTAIDFGPFESPFAALLKRAKQSPTSVALECNGITWTNAYLVAYASTLAQHLQHQELRPGDLVAICVDRSPEMLGAVLAVMMAGGVYVPLDPRHPKERLQMVLDGAGATILLTNRNPGLTTSAKLVNLTNLGTPRLASKIWAGPAPISPTDLAYVIYTSGSTGKPKGVSIEHGALMNLLRSMQREPGLDPSDTLVSITTLSFDIAGLELLLPLLTGAKLVIATDAEIANGFSLLALIEHTKATVLQATPGAWRILIEAGWTNTHPLKALCGGEALPRELAEKLLDRACDVWNVYGPTETTIWSSASRVTRGKAAPRVGPPIANTQFYILDQRREPTPIGITGELYIGGAGLARGYWKQPELTIEKFLTNPFGPGKLYATGDLARWHDDGTIELLGRIDFQLKVRGHRIEAAEIEAAIMENPLAKEVVVMQHTSDSGTSNLVAFIVVVEMPEISGELLAEEFKARLRHTLPEYLLPNTFITLTHLPRNANGKIDRKALSIDLGDSVPGRLYSSSAKGSEYFPPQDIIENQLADIWQTTLGIPQISVRESFFTLGVGSLAALRLITKMNRVYAMELGLASLISASTIEAIAALIRTRFAPNTESSLVPLQPNGTRPPLYIVHGVGGNVVNFYGLSMRVGADQPVYGIQAQALVANQPALLDLKDMAAHYIADIRKQQPLGPYHLLGYSFGGTVALEMAHQLRAAGEGVAMLGMIDAKSRDYRQQLQRTTTVQTKLNRRVSQFRGNTGSLDWRAQVKYIYGKVSTRAIRFACMTATALRIKQIPAFMRSAYDINYVAAQNYKLRPYDGKLILFRASYQGQEEGDHDLGWSSIFSQGVEVHHLPGDHERIFLEPNIETLATSLRQALLRS